MKRKAIDKKNLNISLNLGLLKQYYEKFFLSLSPEGKHVVSKFHARLLLLISDIKKYRPLSLKSTNFELME